MFENLIGQSASGQLKEDIGAGILAPAMLFSGPPASGKGTAALELGRIISCEGAPGIAAWNCPCPACSRHRLLIHPDLLILGFRPFSAEIAASAGAFMRDSKAPSTRILLIRSVRKLLARFNPALWEDDPKAGKIAPMVNTLEEDLDDLDAAISEEVPSTEDAPSKECGEQLKKLCGEILKNAYKLESEAMGETIPIGHIRKAASWSRLAPVGRGKLLIIENCNRMQEEARNSLLKLLEEPPGRLTMVLTTSQPGSLLPTILSRLRPYRFIARDVAAEEEVIKRVFREDVKGKKINDYLDSFLPVSGETLDSLAAFFTASAAYKAAVLCKKLGRPIPEEVVLLGKYTAARAEAAGLGRPQGEGSTVIAQVLEKAEKFEIRSLFLKFLYCLLEQVSRSRSQEASLPSLSYNEVWKECTAWAESAVATYNLRPALALEKLFTGLSRGMAEL